MKPQKLNSKTIGIKTVKEHSLEQSEYLNLPDLQFFKWCNQQYGVNKGVFNTIDNWFFETGIVNIHYRRIYLLAFLDFAIDEGMKQEQDKFIRFGNGGLIRKLHEFFRNQKIPAYKMKLNRWG